MRWRIAAFVKHMSQLVSVTSKHQRAVVIGGSMAGLAVARALSPAFREIVIIERDELARDQPAHRAGVPQSWHIHALLLRGQQELEELFPGFIDAAVRLGAVKYDHAADLVSFTNYGWEPRYESEFIAISGTRALLEFAERERFFALTPNATVIENTRVLDLITEEHDGKLRAAGVVTNNHEHLRIEADLVVDCSGRAALWKRWTEQRDLPLPRESVVDAQCGYTSRIYRPHDPSEFPWKGMVADTAFPNRPRFGAIFPIEDGDWMVTLGGFNGVYPPSDERGFNEFARSLDTPLYAKALERAEPVTRIRSSRRHEMRWNHLESHAHPISGLLAVGDSAWCFNPHYGQGMSIAVTCARILRDVIEENADLGSLQRRYYKRAQKFSWPQWESTSQLDLRWGSTQGKRPWHAKITHPLAELIVRAGQHDRAVSRALLGGIHFLRTPAEVLTPRVWARVFMFALRQLGRDSYGFMTELPAAPRTGALSRRRFVKVA